VVNSRIKYTQKLKILAWSLTLSFFLWAALNPIQFIYLWVTPDQYGQILFNLGHYQKASQHFQSPYRQAVALYASEEFTASATLFSQYDNEHGLLATANSLAHSREYVKAVRIYKTLLELYPDNSAAKTNIPLVQAIIDANTQLSESQVAESGDSSSSDETGPESSEGDERTVFSLTEEAQLDADQLLQDPALMEMWMRQVQVNPSRFLQIKFLMQLEQQLLEQPINPDLGEKQ
jgi:hypothetical protein